MINIYLNKNNIVFAILLTLILAIMLIYIRTYKEGLIFDINYLKTSCPKPKKPVIPRLRLNIPVCKDIIIPTKNTKQQKQFVNNITNTITIPDDIKEEIFTLIPNELIPFKKEIIQITRLSIAKSFYPENNDIKKNLENISANTLYDVENPELIKNAPYIKLFLESKEIQNIIKKFQGTIKEEKQAEIIENIEKNEELINNPTIPLNIEENNSIRTTFNIFIERCGIYL